MPVRGLLRRAQVRHGIRRASTSSPRRSTATRPRCASTTGARSATPASTRRIPGHHLQLSVAGRHPSLSRLTVQAPEFVEGWGMYCEQMMREQGFDDALELPAEHAHRRDLAGLPDHPRRADAPRRDRRRRGDRLPGRADQLRDRQRPRRGPSLHPHARRTSCPTCSARSSCSSCASDEQRRLGDDFSLRGFHDTLLRNGSLPISFHRRLLAGEGASTGSTAGH